MGAILLCRFTGQGMVLFCEDKSGENKRGWLDVVVFVFTISQWYRLILFPQFGGWVVVPLV
jgi:hypothetical protein